jgi:hypothetical protein
MHAWYSAEAAEEFGTYIYSKADGTTVEVTAVYESKELGEEKYKWCDKVYLGEVDKYVRQGREGLWPDCLDEPYYEDEYDSEYYDKYDKSAE